MARKSTFEDLVKSIEGSNKDFKRASKAGRILMVAKDVLDLLKLQRLEVEPGLYVSQPIKLPKGQAKLTNETQMSDLLKLPNLPPCSVCAIGGVMVAATLRLNAVKLGPIVEDGDSRLHFFYKEGTTQGNYNADHGMSARAEEVFPFGLLRLMEKAFESGLYGYGRVATGEARFSSIYRNIVKNNGKKFTAYADGWDDEDESERNRVKKGETIYRV